MKKVFSSIVLAFAFFISLQAQNNAIFQYSTIDALIKGSYDGDMLLGDLVKQGDFGIGTFNTLDGEMILLDGIFYRADGTGKVLVVGPESKTPFASVTFFRADKTVEIPAGTTMTRITAIVDSLIPIKNLFYAIKIKGDFSNVKTRSVPAQQKPYRPLTEVVKNQPVFSFDNAAGVILGFRCPSNVGGINVPGYHLHFLESNLKGGGHVLGFTTSKTTLEIQEISSFSLKLPDSKDFYSSTPGTVNEEDIKKVEK